ncbi:hypothetical protein [Endozoicomonas sp. SESOKO1]|uniref:hypothetical protein n=1 Tax=Endozoicomonas sp. SESOKO1 TaxID=2828742 RepID=UPI0021498591|nr:hypothetical protein [Endozoicomonas sp. SESOKO1]
MGHMIIWKIVIKASWKETFFCNKQSSTECTDPRGACLSNEVEHYGMYAKQVHTKTGAYESAMPASLFTMVDIVYAATTRTVLT